MPTSLLYSIPFVPVETQPDGYLVGKELVILLFECVVGKCFVVFYVFTFPPAVYVGTLNLIASIPDPSVLTWHNQNIPKDYVHREMLAAHDHSCFLFFFFFSKIHIGSKIQGH